MYARILAVFLSLLLFAVPAQAATQSFSGLFSLTYDETVYKADTISWLDQNDGINRWLMMLGANDHLFDVTLSRAEQWEHITLSDPASAMTTWYLEDMTASGFEHLDTLTANGTVFGLFRAFDDDGEYLLGETIVSGWLISFYGYYDDPERPVDDALTDALRELLESYQPQK